jgi:CheY-like chemotaxis protein
LAEDNPVNQRLAARLLEKEGHLVCIANNGDQALSLLERELFDIILMDIQMPIMDGLEAVRRIRAQETRKHIPIVAITAHAMSGDKERYLSMGIDAYVAKPIDRKVLLTTIRDLTQNSGVT